MDFNEVVELSKDKLEPIKEILINKIKYIHSVRVAKIVNELVKDLELQKVALLHDIIEDSDVTYEYLSGKGINKYTMALIKELTNNNKEIRPLEEHNI